MKLSLGFSPCPNDTFIFDALVNKKIDTEDFEFDVMLEDVQTLNQWTLKEKLDITKLSFPAFFRESEKYVLLNSGSALGKGVGPLVISKDKNPKQRIEELTIALPGINTTANLLFSFVYPRASKKKFMIFSAIENAVFNGETDLGVIIHENRFTYQQKGLHKVVDLGEYWEEKMKVPIPLGGIAIKRKFEESISKRISRLIKKSIEYSYKNYPFISDYIKNHSQEMSEDVMRKHIDLYVNNFSIDLGIDGKQAIETLRDVYNDMHPENTAASHPIFI